MDGNESKTFSVTCSNEFSDTLIREVQAWAKVHGIEVDIVVQDYYMPPSIYGSLVMTSVSSFELLTDEQRASIYDVPIPREYWKYYIESDDDQQT